MLFAMALVHMPVGALATLQHVRSSVLPAPWHCSPPPPVQPWCSLLQQAPGPPPPLHPTPPVMTHSVAPLVGTTRNGRLQGSARRLRQPLLLGASPPGSYAIPPRRGRLSRASAGSRAVPKTPWPCPPCRFVRRHRGVALLRRIRPLGSGYGSGYPAPAAAPAGRLRASRLRPALRP
jgi:hypothetical protein